MGYLCELSNPLMNYRWWLMQTLTVRPRTSRARRQSHCAGDLPRPPPLCPFCAMNRRAALPLCPHCAMTRRAALLPGRPLCAPSVR